MPICVKCNGSGWVCEDHSDMPHEHYISFGFIKKECGGAGMLCICNKANLFWNFAPTPPTEKKG